MGRIRAVFSRITAPVAGFTNRLRHTGSQVGRRVSQFLLGIGRVMNHPGFLASLVMLAIIVAAAWGYWYYEISIRRPRELRHLGQEIAQLQGTLDTLRQSAQDLPTSVEYRHPQSSLLSPMDGLRALDGLTLLADRTGTTLSSLDLSPGAAKTVGETELTVFDVGFSCSGDSDSLRDFISAINQGIVPGLVVGAVQTTVDQEKSTLNVQSSLFTLPAQQAGSTIMPVFLKAGATPFEELQPKVSSDAASDVPILAFTVESLFNGMDALRSVRVQASPPGAVSSFKLYAEVPDQRDNAFPLGTEFTSVLNHELDVVEPDCRSGPLSACPREADGEQSVLIATGAIATPDGGFIIRPTSHFAFPGQREQRFFITADLHPLDVQEAMVEIGIPPGGVSFTSGTWPGQNVPAPLISRFQMRRPPVAESRRFVVNFGGETPIGLDTGHSASDSMSFVLITPPSQGELEGSFPDFRYVHSGHGVGDDSFTYRIEEGDFESADAKVTLDVVKTVNIEGVPDSSPEGEPIALASTINDLSIGEISEYDWTVTKDGASFDSGNGADFSFTPLDEGTYQVSLSVRSNDGGIARDIRNIQITNVSPAVRITVLPSDEPDDTAIRLNSSIADPGQGEVLTYHWSVTRDGELISSGTEASFSFNPDMGDGVYLVSLSVSDNGGGKGQDSISLQVAQGKPLNELPSESKVTP